MWTNVKGLQCLSWNVNGLPKRMTDLHGYVLNSNIDVVALQETLDRDGTLVVLRNYQHFFLPAGEGVRGVSVYIKNIIPVELVSGPGKNGG